MLLTPGIRSPCARSGDIAVPIARPATKTMAVRMGRSSRNWFGGGSQASMNCTVGRVLFFGPGVAGLESKTRPTARALRGLASFLRKDLEVLVVLVADVFQQFRVGPKNERQRDIPWLRIRA